MKLFTSGRREAAQGQKIAQAQKNFDSAVVELLDAVENHLASVETLAATDIYLADVLKNMVAHYSLAENFSTQPEHTVGNNQASTALADAYTRAWMGAKLLAHVSNGVAQGEPIDDGTAKKIKEQQDIMQRRLRTTISTGTVADIANLRRSAAFGKQLGLSAEETAALLGEGAYRLVGPQTRLSITTDGDRNPILLSKEYYRGEGTNPAYYAGDEAAQVITQWRESGGLDSGVRRNTAAVAWAKEKRCDRAEWAKRRTVGNPQPSEEVVEEQRGGQPYTRREVEHKHSSGYAR